MSRSQITPFRTLCLLFVLVIAAKPAMAQRLRAETDLLREEAVRTELGLVGERASEMEQLLKNTTPGKDFFDPFLKRIGETKDAAERTKIREEMNEAVKAKSEEMKANALNILSDTQKKKLRGIFLRSSGMRAFSDARVAKEYAVTEEQTGKLEELATEFRTASRSIEDLSEEDREKFNTEWKNKFLAVLTPEQKTRYDAESAYGEQPAIAASTAPASAAPGVRPQDMTEPPPGEQAIGSFGGGAPGESQRVSEFRFNFRYESWERVLQMYADGAGLTLDLNQIPPGTFSHYDDNAYTARQTLDILNGYLHRKGFAMIENDGFLIVMNTDNGIPPYLIRDVTEEQLLKVGKELEVGNNELANFRMSVDGMDTAKVAQEVEALLGPLGSLVALTESQLLIMTDVGANLRRIHGFLTAAMSKSKPDALIFQAYHLKHMDAEEAEIQVKTQFGMRQGATNVSVSTEQSRTRGGFQPQPQSRTAAPAAPLASASSEPAIQIAADLRLNSLLVTGTAKQQQLVTTILDALDVSESPDGSPLARGRKGTYLEVYQVKSADSGEVTKTLAAMNIPGVQVVNEDRKTGRVHIMATERQHEEVAALIRQLDGAGVSGSVAVISLAQMDPLSAATTLRSLFLADGTDAPTIETDLYGRRLIVRGSIEQITQIKQVLADLGEDGTGVRDRGEGGLVRRFSLQGRNPEQFLQVLQQQWDSQQETKINIVIPNESGPINSRRTPEEEIERPTQRERGDAGDPLSSRARQAMPETQSGWIEWKRSQHRTAERMASPTAGSDTAASNWRVAASPVHADEGATGTAPQKDAAGGQPGSQEPPLRRPWSPENRQNSGRAGEQDSDVVIQLLGDDLILSGTDETMLDRLEDLLDFLHQSLPMKPEYTVVYLKAADALEAADMLSQFFPSSSVASTSMTSGSSMLGSLGSSFSGMGSSLMDMTGLSGLGASSSTLKIIPDIRTNSLFLTGPQSMIRDALAFLRVLDSNDIPESLKDMQPRQIMVAYADVNDVSNLLKEVFKPYMEAQGGGKNQQQNPLAMMFGGGGGGGGGRGAGNEATQVRMTLGVDAQTSTLTVNCSQEIFQEVEQVVQSMDSAAQAAKPMVLPIQLKNADALLIQQMLGSLVPRVSVSTSRTNTSSSSTSSSSGSSSGGGPSGGDNNAAAQAQQEAMNREIQNRIRERMQQGGGGTQGGGTPGGGRGGFGGFGGFPGGGGRGTGGGGGRGR